VALRTTTGQARGLKLARYEPDSTFSVAIACLLLECFQWKRKPLTVQCVARQLPLMRRYASTVKRGWRRLHVRLALA